MGKTGTWATLGTRGRTKTNRKKPQNTKEDKGNNKITELRTILQRESQNSYVYKQTKSVNNRKTVKTVMTLKTSTTNPTKRPSVIRGARESKAVSVEARNNL
jgi:hypothetical protein